MSSVPSVKPCSHARAYHLKKTIARITLTASLVMPFAFAYGTDAAAYTLYKAESCNPGAAWDTSNPIKVKLLNESFSGLSRFPGWW